LIVVIVDPPEINPGLKYKNSGSAGLLGKAFPSHHWRIPLVPLLQINPGEIAYFSGINS
jgi:hypothetical protein